MLNGPNNAEYPKMAEWPIEARPAQLVASDYYHRWVGGA